MAYKWDWRGIGNRVLREGAAPRGLAFAFTLAFAANGAIHAGNFLLSRQGADTSTVAYATAIQAVGIVCAAPLMLLLVRKQSRPNIAAVAAVLAALGFAAIFSEAFPLLNVIGRFMLGCGVGLGMAFTEYTVVSSARRDTRALFATAFGIVLAAGHAAGTLVTMGVGQSWLLPLGVIPLLVAGISMRPWGRLDSLNYPQAYPKGGLGLLISPVYLVAAALYGFLDNGLLSMLPDFLQSAGHAKDQTVSASFLAFAGICALQIPAGIMCIRFDPFAVLRVAVLSLGVALLALTASLQAGLLFTPFAFLLGGLVDLIYTAALIALSNNVSRRQLAPANAFFVSFCGIGEVSGPLMTGPALGSAGFGGMVALIVTMLSMFWLLALWRGSKPGAELLESRSLPAERRLS